MKLRKLATGEAVEAEIASLEPSDYKRIKNSKRFEFDWKEESGKAAYKIFLRDTEEIMGVMALMDIPLELRIHLDLIEVAKEQVGKNKQVDGIAGCLIAFACQQAFSRGYGGFVSLQPKTKLIKHYMQQYGFRQYGRLLGIDFEGARDLISKYLDA